MLRKLIFPHTLIVAILTFILIWFVDLIRLNLHFLDPFNKGLKDYEVTDIVYSKLRDDRINLDERIVLVNTGKPNRDTLALMLNRIIDAQPKVIGIDLLLSDRKTPHADSALQACLKRYGNTVLGTRLDGYNEDTRQFEAEVDCDTFFCDHAYPGFTNFPANDTRTIRIFSPKEETKKGESLAFSVRVTKLYDAAASDRLLARDKEVEEIYFFGDADNFLQFEPENILDTSINLTPLLKDKIILVGFLGSYSWGDPLIDRHFTPLNSQYTGRNVPDMYGMVIHANVIKMILDNYYVRELSPLVNLLLTFLFTYFNIHLFYKIHHRIGVQYQFVTRFLQIGEIILLFFLVAVTFHFFRFKIDFALSIAALLLTFDIIKFYENFLRKRFTLLNNIPEVLPQKLKAKKTPPPPPQNSAGEKG
ncbi:MAG: CHASE2 domain-containing protein [Saprospiraceae bacterium]|nr:CHASE2 domain-containing protein [Saprospiraceae bacterium]